MIVSAIRTPPSRSFGARELEEADERGRRQVFDDLAREDRAEASVRLRLEVSEQVRLLDVEPFAARVGDHVAVGVDSARLHAGVAEQRDELPAAAADVEHGRVAAKIVDVGTLPLAHELGRAAHAALEGEVVREGRGRRLGGHRLLRPGGAALEPEHPLLQLRDQAPSGVSVYGDAVELLEERVDQLQRRVVEAPLLLGERLDVPAHRLAEHFLQELDGRAPVGRAFRGDGPELLGRGPRAGTRAELGAVRPPAELVAESFEQGLDVDLLRGWSGHCGKCKEGGLRRC